MAVICVDLSHHAWRDGGVGVGGGATADRGVVTAWFYVFIRAADEDGAARRPGGFPRRTKLGKLYAQAVRDAHGSALCTRTS